jgi:hypothetical protein
MKFVVNFAEAVSGDVSIDFGRCDRGVAEEFLDDAKVSAVFEEVRREAVTEHVRGDISSDPRTANALFDAKPKGDGSKGSAAPGEKDIGGRAWCYQRGSTN